jgi:hypothetical protein
MTDRKFSTLASALSAAAVLVSVSASAQAQQVASVQAVQAGVAAAVRGQVKLVSFRAPEAVGKNIASGDAVFLGDKVEAGPKAGLQIMLMDETIFTIGPDSAIVIDKFIYDPEKGGGKVSAKILRGVFRFVSGRVAANKPSDMEVKLPNGTIGIRGTSAGGFVRNGVSEVVLLGPGPENNVGEPGGRIIVSGAGSNVDISRVNFGTRLAGGAAPTAPIRWDAQKMNSLTGALRSARPNRPDGPDQQQSPGSAPAQNAGPDQNDASNGNTGPRPGPGTDSGDTVTQQAGQDIGGAAVGSGLLHRVGARQGAIGDHAGAHINQLKNTLAGIATVAQLNQITTGTFTYNPTTVPMGTGSNYVFNYSINFAAKSTSGSVQVNTSSLDTGFANASGTFALNHNIFTEPSGVLDITEGGPTTHVPGLNANDNRITVQYKFVNDGALASRIEHSVSYAEPQSAPTRSLSGSGSSDRPQ